MELVGAAPRSIPLYSIDRGAIPPGATVRFRCQLNISVPVGSIAEARSVQCLGDGHGVRVHIGPRILDPGYSGEVFVELRNDSQDSFLVHDGDRVAELVFGPFPTRPRTAEKAVA